MRGGALLATVHTRWRVLHRHLAVHANFWYGDDDFNLVLNFAILPGRKSLNGLIGPSHYEVRVC